MITTASPTTTIHAGFAGKAFTTASSAVRRVEIGVYAQSVALGEALGAITPPKAAIFVLIALDAAGTTVVVVEEDVDTISAAPDGAAGALGAVGGAARC